MQAWPLDAVVFRTIEDSLLHGRRSCLLSLLTLSQEFDNSGSCRSSSLQAIGNLLP